MKFANLAGNSFLKFPGAEEWKLPFGLAVGLHVIAFCAAVFLPQLLPHRPRLPEFYTVDLFTASELPPSGAEPVPTIRPDAGKKETAAPPPAPVQPDRPTLKIREPEIEESGPAPISLTPSRHKVKVARKPEKAEIEIARLTEAMKRIQERLAEKEARQEADQAAAEAVNRLARTLQAEKAVGETRRRAASATPEKMHDVSGGTAGDGVQLELVLKHYLAAVHNRINAHWVLPEMQNWDAELTAVLVITIRNDGIVTDSFFEKKSSNLYFNQFVRKAIREAAPLPPFPPELDRQSIEIGLRFRPGELL